MSENTEEFGREEVVELGRSSVRALANYRDVLRTESPVSDETKARLVQEADELFWLCQRIKVAAGEIDGLKRYIYYGKGDRKPKLVPEDKLGVGENARLIHALIGLIGEAGEIAEALQKVMKGQADDVNLVEEFGDLRWYQELGLDVLGSTMEEVEDKNARKLMARYGSVFSKEAALNRNLEAEREQLES